MQIGPTTCKRKLDWFEELGLVGGILEVARPMSAIVSPDGFSISAESPKGRGSPGARNFTPWASSPRIKVPNVAYSYANPGADRRCRAAET